MNQHVDESVSRPPDEALQAPILDIGMFWRRKWTLLLSAVMSVGAGVVYVFLAPSHFDAQARLLVQQNGFSFQDQPRLEDREFLATQAEIIRSPVTISDALKAVPLEGLDAEQDPVKAAIDTLGVTPVLNTDVLRISFRSNDSEQTVAFVDAVIRSYRKQLNTVERDSNAQSLELLSQREDQLRGDLQQLQQQHLVHRKSVPLVGQGRDAVHVAGELLRQLSTQVAQSQRRRVAVENAVEALASYRQAVANRRRGNGVFAAASTGDLASRPAKPQPPAGISPHMISMAAQMLQSVSSPSVQEISQLQAELRQATATERELAQTYGVQHPRRRGVIEQIEALRGMIRDWDARASTMLEQELAVARRTEKHLVSLYGEEREQIKAMDQFLVRDQQLLDQIRRAEAMHDLTLTKFNELTLAAESISTGRPSVTVRLLQGPRSTLRKIWPKKVPVVLVCGVLGLLGAAVWISLRTRGAAAGRSS